MGIKLAFVVSEFNYDITYLMLQRAKSHAEFLEAEISAVVKVPGVYEMPLAVSELLKKEGIDAVVTLGAVIQGETEHDDVIMHQATRKMLDLSVEYRKPVALGIIGPGATRSQAQERIDEYARRAVEAAIKMARRLKKIRASQEKETCQIE